MARNRAGATHRGANAPAIVLSRSFSPTDTPPTPYDMEASVQQAVELGFPDADTMEARFFFERVSLQHASEYFGTLGNGETLMGVHRAMLFDRKMQALLLENIGLFELQFRAQYSRSLSVRHGAFAHRNPSNFRNQSHFDEFLRLYGEELSRQVRSRNGHVVSAIGRWGDAPTWLAVEIMSFGTLSKLYGNTRDNRVRDDVCNSFGVARETLESWTRALTVARNKCAHFSRLFGRPLTSRPRQIRGVGCDNGSAFYLFLVLGRLLSGSQLFESDPTLCYWLAMVEDVANLIYRFGDVAFSCGVPTNWNELLLLPEVVGGEGGMLPQVCDDRTMRVEMGFSLEGNATPMSVNR